ncbi:hypothetical protein [Salinispora arenicola]|uniref:hypothetical protein n=1 Tax=Salinispora arenicola TaxID=168697 RepID=UPI000382E869|nr:hypothetical protein [Salinispora arenicola]
MLALFLPEALFLGGQGLLLPLSFLGFSSLPRLLGLDRPTAFVVPPSGQPAPSP